MGLFAHLLHLGPRDVDELTVEEFDELCNWIDRHQAAAAKEVPSG
ncbi:hypothetical protein ACFQ7B_07520 [Streptomyces erythrochromogenes]